MSAPHYLIHGDNRLANEIFEDFQAGRFMVDRTTSNAAGGAVITQLLTLRENPEDVQLVIVGESAKGYELAQTVARVSRKPVLIRKSEPPNFDPAVCFLLPTDTAAADIVALAEAPQRQDDRRREREHDEGGHAQQRNRQEDDRFDDAADMPREGGRFPEPPVVTRPSGPASDFGTERSRDNDPPDEREPSEPTPRGERRYADEPDYAAEDRYAEDDDYREYYDDDPGIDRQQDVGGTPELDPLTGLVKGRLPSPVEDDSEVKVPSSYKGGIEPAPEPPVNYEDEFDISYRDDRSSASRSAEPAQRESGQRVERKEPQEPRGQSVDNRVESDLERRERELRERELELERRERERQDKERAERERQDQERAELERQELERQELERREQELYERERVLREQELREQQEFGPARPEAHPEPPIDRRSEQPLSGGGYGGIDSTDTRPSSQAKKPSWHLDEILGDNPALEEEANRRTQYPTPLREDDYMPHRDQLPRSEEPLPKEAVEFEMPPPATFGHIDDPTFASSQWADQVEDESKGKGTIIGVVAAKGGVGKSSMSLWIAEALVASNQTVAVCDANIGQADIGKMLNITDTPGIGGLIGPNRFTSDDLSKVLVDSRAGQILISPPDPLETDLQQTLATLNLAVDMLARNNDYVVIDAPVATVFEPIYSQCVLHAADLLIIILNPHLPTLEDTKTWLKALWKPQAEGGLGWSKNRCVGVLNRADPKAGIEVGYIQQFIPELKVIARVPKIDEVVQGINLKEWRCPTEARTSLANLTYDLFHVSPGGRVPSESAAKPKAQSSTGFLKRLIGR